MERARFCLVYVKTIRVEKKTRKMIRHWRQEESWDCGIACILMILCHLQVEGYKFLSKEARDRLIDDSNIVSKTGKSIWSIDLANALYKATGRRHYHQPFILDRPPLVG